MKTFKSLTWLTAFAAMLFSVASANEQLIAAQKVSLLDKQLVLNGIGVNQKFRDDLYFGALYVEVPMKDPSLADTKMAKRMEVRIIKDRQSARSFARMWVEALKINNEREVVQKLLKEIGQFNKLLKGSLRTGDQLTFDYHPSIGTRVALNGVRLGDIPGIAFYQALLRSWVGERPPTSQFKEGILGRDENKVRMELLKRFVDLKATDARTAQIQTWVEPQASQRLAAATTAAQPAASSTQHKPQPKSEVHRVAAQAEQSVKEQVAVAESTANATKAMENAIEQAPTSTAKPSTSQAQTKVASAPPKPEPRQQIKQQTLAEASASANPDLEAATPATPAAKLTQRTTNNAKVEQAKVALKRHFLVREFATMMQQRLTDEQAIASSQTLAVLGGRANKGPQEQLLTLKFKADGQLAGAKVTNRGREREWDKDKVIQELEVTPELPVGLYGNVVEVTLPVYLS